MIRPNVMSNTYFIEIIIDSERRQAYRKSTIVGVILGNNGERNFVILERENPDDNAHFYFDEASDAFVFYSKVMADLCVT